MDSSEVFLNSRLCDDALEIVGRNEMRLNHKFKVDQDFEFSSLFEGRCIGQLWDLFGSFSSRSDFFWRSRRGFGMSLKWVEFYGVLGLWDFIICAIFVGSQTFAS